MVGCHIVIVDGKLVTVVKYPLKGLKRRVLNCAVYNAEVNQQVEVLIFNFTVRTVQVPW